ncbi:hypothetical protein KC19_VG179400 [Ceratodon purpureus]|uniref:Uncharacterized protein n=1 Tax=Ceratodon purpureus TaxID=3225 RepID=A0A8T0HRM8_CERPU|nr:hypothetical protein KC19_VG179400 [Ceratodon purpureus]
MASERTLKELKDLQKVRRHNAAPRRRHRQRQRRWHWNHCLMGDQLSRHYAFTGLSGHESLDLVNAHRHAHFNVPLLLTTRAPKIRYFASISRHGIQQGRRDGRRRDF